MSTEHFKRMEEVFQAALGLPELQREAYVRDACSDDEPLRRRVLRMLSNADRELICDDLTNPLDAGGPEGELDDLVGTTIGGRYQVIERIGHGGFGVVYKAEQVEPVRRPVALKIIKLGMDTERIIARFEAERQALAMMDHPHIARVFDAGAAESGRPFFVMELVDGRPITAFCDEQQLSITSRLNLFMQVCHAVQHAHQKGVIHRDIKPSNVLVTIHEGRAVPKVIDFGIAKATQGRLTDRTLLTEHRHFVGTPQYMSPEQASLDGLPVDTRTDIYSLGVLLYELLVGVTPFESRTSRHGGPEEILRKVREQDPRKPSAKLTANSETMHEVAQQRGMEPRALQRYLSGDLDWIALKALEKEPDRRYETAADLAHEIERHLADEPIMARPPGPLYLMEKFIRRNQVVVTAAAVITVTLLVGLIVAVMGLNEARSAQVNTEEALTLAHEHLLESLQAQAMAARNSDQIGRRFQALSALAKAVEIEPDRPVRDAAVAVMALPDFQIGQTYDAAPLHMLGARGLRRLDRFGQITGPGELLIQPIDSTRSPTSLTTLPLRIWIIQFSDDGQYVAAKLHDRADDAYIVVWHIESAETVITFSDLTARDYFAFCRIDGSHALAVGGESRIDLYQLPDGQHLRRLDLPNRAHRFISDVHGTRLACTHQDEPAVSIWSLDEPKQLAHFAVPAAMRDLAWHPEGHLLAGCGTDFNLHLLDVATGQSVMTLYGHEGEPIDVFFADDPSVLGSYSWDATTRLWNLRTGEPLVGPLLDTRLIGLRDAMLTADATGIKLWHYEPARECQRAHCRQPFGTDVHLAFSPCGTMLLSTGDNGVRLWDADTVSELAVILEKRPTFAQIIDSGRAILIGDQTAIAMHPLQRSGGVVRVGDGRRIVERDVLRGASFDERRGELTICTDSSIETVDMNGNLITRAPGHAGFGRVPVLDPARRWLFTTNWRGPAARLWDFQSGETVQTFPGAHVLGTFSPDGRALMVSTSERIDMRSTDSWAVTRSWHRTRSDDLAGLLAFASEKNVMAFTHSRFEIHIADVDRDDLLLRLTLPQPAAISALAVSHDAGRIAAATAGGQLAVWDLHRIGESLQQIGVSWP